MIRVTCWPQHVALITLVETTPALLSERERRCCRATVVCYHWTESAATPGAPFHVWPQWVGLAVRWAATEGETLPWGVSRRS